MNAICVDDEERNLATTAAQCRELPGIREVTEFRSPSEALAWLDGHRADLALLDVDMPEMNGIDLAVKIKSLHPDTAVLFLADDPQYALASFAAHPSAYLLRPVSTERLAEEVAYAASRLPKRTAERTDHILVKTFGNFDVFVDGRPVRFRMARCKELLAYLVDRQGSGVTRAEAFSVLWEDRSYDRKMQKQLDVYIRSLRESLREQGIEDIFELSRGCMRIIPERFTCDAYLFFSGDGDAVNAYRGEYMNNYSWASMTESVMFWMQRDRK